MLSLKIEHLFDKAFIHFAEDLLELRVSFK